MRGRGATLAAGAFGALLACTAETPAPRPHLVLVMIDNLRADHLGAYGYERATSPTIDRLAREGVLFANAFASSSWTKPSVASLFTSRLPSEHGAVSFAAQLGGVLPTLAERLRDAGYCTVGVSGNFIHVTEATGLARGFDVWQTLFRRLGEAPGDTLIQLPAGGAAAARLAAPDAHEVNREALRRLPPSAATPLFLYLHYMEPHAGYLPPERERAAFARPGSEGGPPATSDYVVDLAAGRATPGPREHDRLVDLYDAEIAAADAALRELLEALDSRGLLQNAVLVVVSDHGEEFGEHGGWFHALTLHAESLRVPLVIRDGRRSGPGERRFEPVDLLDVAPTLLALAGSPPSPGMRGRSLLGTAALPPRDLVAELHPDPLFEAHVVPRVQRLALLRWPWKVVQTRDGRPLVFRLDRDPGERVAVDPGEIPEELLGRASRLGRRLEAAERELARPVVDGGTREGLRALGYAD